MYFLNLKLHASANFELINSFVWVSLTVSYQLKKLCVIDKRSSLKEWVYILPKIYRVGSRDFTIKLFLRLLWILCCNKLERLSLSVTFTQVYYLQARLEPNPLEPLTGLLYKSRNWLRVTNTLAYYAMEFFAAVKSL